MPTKWSWGWNVARERRLYRQEAEAGAGTARKPLHAGEHIMFPASEVELPSADKYNAFPPEAQKAILAGFQLEQTERHAWLKNQQRNDHALRFDVGSVAAYAHASVAPGDVPHWR